MKSIMDVCRQVDAGRWEIYEGIRVIGYFESDGKSYEFKSCAGPTIGGNGEIYGNQPVKWYLLRLSLEGTSKKLLSLAKSIAIQIS